MDWLERAYQCRVTEKEIRDWLSSHGYFGNSAQFQELELHAIQKPGWVQVFRFSVLAKPATFGHAPDFKTRGERNTVYQDASDQERSDQEESNWVQLYGTSRDDQRHRTEIAIFESDQQRNQLLEQWSEGLIRRKVSTPCRSHCAMDLVWFAAALMCLMVMLAFLLRY